MGGFNRFCHIVFALAGGVALAALLLPWLGPWTRQATALLAIDWYDYVIEACCLILAFGLVIALFRGIFSRRADAIVVTSVDGGEVTISRDAIASQAAHIVEEDGTCQADDVIVKAKRSGKVRVTVRILPFKTVDVTAKGPELHQALVDGLGSLCADKLKSVDLEFLEPETPSDVSSESTVTEPVPSYHETTPAPAKSEAKVAPSESGESHSSSALDLDRLESFASGESEEPSPSDTGDITVSMHNERSE